VRAIFANGQLSGWLNEVVNAVIFSTTPADVTGFAIAVTGDLATLTWDAVDASTGISHFEIRYSPVPSAFVTWQTATLLRSPVTGAQAQVPPLRGTYLIKAVSYSGLQSLGPAIVVSTIDGLTSFNAVEDIQELAPFPGAKDGTFFDGTALRLGSASDFFAPDDFFAAADFFLSSDGYLPQGYYYFADVVDLDDVYTSRLTAQIDAHGQWSSDDFFALGDFFGRADFFGDIGSKWNVGVEVSTTEEDPVLAPAWSDWAALVTGDVSARAYRFRARLESQQPDITPIVDAITVTVDMPDRVIAGNDIVVPSGGVGVSFSPAFKHLQGVSIAAQGLATGDYYLITAKSETGFNIAFKNAAGADISRTFDYVAKGYGNVQ
jgi:hypothetical protein